MDDQDSSSTGLMIGIIIGGVVAVVLIVLGIGFFFLLGASRDEAFAPVPRPEARDAEAPAPLDPPKGPAGEEGPPWPNPKRVGDAEQKLLGAWKAEFKDGRTEHWDIRDDKSMRLIRHSKGKKEPDVTTVGTWEVTVELGDGPGTILWYEMKNGGRHRWNIKYLDDDSFVVVPTVTLQVDGVPVKGPDEHIPYRRQRPEKKS